MRTLKIFKTPKSKIIARFEQAQDRLVLQASDLSLETISNMVSTDAVNLDPSYQRRERWTTEQQSALIESFLLNIPVPPIYLAEESFGVYTAIDGKQRMAAIHRFMRSKLRLKGLESFKELEGATFESLPTDLQNALRIRPYIRAITLLKQSSPELKYEVFTRLNRQGVPLNPQEIRNVLFRGPLNELVYKLAEDAFLRHQLKIKGPKSPAYRDMDDAEYVLRFFTLLDTHRSFSGSFRRSMDDYMESNRKPPTEQLNRLQSAFERAITACRSIWGAHAFKRATNGRWRNQFLAGMFDAQMIACATVSDSTLARAEAHANNLLESTLALFTEDGQFEAAVREATNTPSRIQYRIERVSELLQAA